jgi:hypothetical protein
MGKGALTWCAGRGLKRPVLREKGSSSGWAGKRETKGSRYPLSNAGGHSCIQSAAKQAETSATAAAAPLKIPVSPLDSAAAVYSASDTPANTALMNRLDRPIDLCDGKPITPLWDLA